MSVPDTLFVAPDWLAARLDDERIVPVDASFYLPDEGKDAEALFREGHIPGAVRFDVDAVADHAIPLPHMLPDAEAFGRMVGASGIASDSTVVVYDSTDLLGGARAWWMFKHYGAADVRLLEGGYRAWKAGSFPVETGPAKRAPQKFDAHYESGSVFDAKRVLSLSRSGEAQIVDARAAPRFAGAVAEPRPGLRAGHIPNSRNLPWREVLDADGRLKTPDAIAAAFARAGVEIDRPIVATCGSGVSAAILLLGLERRGRSHAGLYDGSWAEWGARQDLPIEMGTPRT